MKPIITWTSRLLGILLAIMIPVFAQPQLDLRATGWSGILTILIGLIPFYVVAIGVALSWKRPWIGAFLFIALAVWYSSGLFKRAHPMQLTSYVIVGLSVLGLLFLCDWMLRRKRGTLLDDFRAGRVP